MNDNKLVVVVLAATVGIIGGGMLLAYTLTRPPQVEAVAGARAEITQAIHEWGEIPINGGDVTAVFNITNSGSETLKLYNGTTSCACTLAQLKRGEEKSPPFGMHTRSASVFEIPPGETAELEATFDPDFHGPNGVGAVTRQATLQTNDPNQPQLSFNMTGMVVK